MKKLCKPWFVLGFVPGIYEPADVRNFTQTFIHTDTENEANWSMKNEFRRCGNQANEQVTYKLIKHMEQHRGQMVDAQSGDVVATTDDGSLTSFDVERSVEIPFVTQFTGMTIPDTYRLDINYIKKDIICKCAINPAIRYVFMICSKSDKSAYWLLAETPHMSQLDMVIAKNIIEKVMGLSWDRMHFVAQSTL